VGIGVPEEREVLRASHRLLLAMVVAALAFPALSLPTAAPVAAVGFQCTDANLPNELPPAPGGRTWVLYDANEITDPTKPDAQARSAAIARELQRRADAALNHYDAFGLAVPAAATSKVLCAPGLGITDRNAVTPAPGNVQFKSSYVREQFADAEFNGTGFEDGAWNSACRNSARDASPPVTDESASTVAASPCGGHQSKKSGRSSTP
jgi:hypothetical protein